MVETYIIADNQELTAYAVESLLTRDPQHRVLRATNRAELTALLQQHEHAVVVLDYKLFDFPDEDALLIVGERFSMTQWILLSDELSERFLRRVIYSSHTFSVLFKDLPLKALRDALEYAASNKRYVCQRATEMLLVPQEAPALPQLTATERDIVRAIAQGKTTKEIAIERFSSIHTVNTHRKNIFHKLGVNTAHEVIKYALKAGLIDPSEFYI